MTPEPDVAAVVRMYEGLTLFSRAMLESSGTIVGAVVCAVFLGRDTILTPV